MTEPTKPDAHKQIIDKLDREQRLMDGEPDYAGLVKRLELTFNAWHSLPTDGIWSHLTIDRDAVCNMLAEAAAAITKLTEGEK